MAATSPVSQPMLLIGDPRRSANCEPPGSAARVMRADLADRERGCSRAVGPRQQLADPAPGLGEQTRDRVSRRVPGDIVQHAKQPANPPPVSARHALGPPAIRAASIRAALNRSPACRLHSSSPLAQAPVSMQSRSLVSGPQRPWRSEPAPLVGGRPARSGAQLPGDVQLKRSGVERCRHGLRR